MCHAKLFSEVGLLISLVVTNIFSVYVYGGYVVYVREVLIDTNVAN